MKKIYYILQFFITFFIIILVVFVSVPKLVSIVNPEVIVSSPVVAYKVPETPPIDYNEPRREVSEPLTGSMSPSKPTKPRPSSESKNRTTHRSVAPEFKSEKPQPSGLRTPDSSINKKVEPTLEEITKLKPVAEPISQKSEYDFEKILQIISNVATIVFPLTGIILNVYLWRNRKQFLLAKNIAKDLL
jgi:hypothetical protein